jgi:calcineurin-like phosphoesterase family protein
MARIRDTALSSLITSFPIIVGASSGEAREPHVTLYGPFRSRSRGDVILDRIREASLGMNSYSGMIGDLIRLKGVRGGALAISLSPGVDLTGFYQRLVLQLSPVATRCTWIDRGPGHRIFHISLRFNVPFREFDALWKRVSDLTPSGEYKPGEGKRPVSPLRTYLQACDSPLTIFRITVLRRGTIWRELDLPRSLWLSRKEAGDMTEWDRTYRKYRIDEGMELHENAQGTSPRQYVISDLHLGHRNIIHYCRRPFFSSEEMDNILTRNWNHKIGPADEVFYLGDLCHGKNSAPASEYLSRLNGRIHIISGNHDEAIPGAVQSLQFHCDTTDLFLIHDPAQAPADFHGWVIHGHMHNNDVRTYPFVNAGTRTINVSAELVDYTPVSLDEICRFLKRIGPEEKILSLKEARARYSSG